MVLGESSCPKGSQYVWVGSSAQRVYKAELRPAEVNLRLKICLDQIRVSKKQRLLQFSKYHNIYPVKSIENMLDRKNINTILNLTPPEKHFEINKKCLLGYFWVFGGRGL